MITIGEALKKGEDILLQSKIFNSRREAVDLLSHILGCGGRELHLQFQSDLSLDHQQQFFSIIQKRAQNIPFAYLVGKVDFGECEISVSPSVLIPRQETELLWDLIVSRLKNLDLNGRVLWDLCTGSGCLGIALKKRFPELKVSLIDISDEALKVASVNAKNNQVDVAIVKSDLLANISGSFDFLVCNPPYIAQKEYNLLEKEVKNYEPKLALVSGSSGLECYKVLSKQIQEKSNSGALSFFEMGETQGALLKKMFECDGYQDVVLEQDLASKDRFLSIKSA